ncbi:MAG: homocysteine S-methyltransferase family protein, partial [Myxococcales bacterium]|nr:homocysteine S-methyltransferase family protein [Myxococcales bacterium]
MRRRSFLEALEAGALVLDGAMGTALYEQGLLYTGSLDQASIARPEIVRRIHDGYVLAGADALTTNSFGANRYRLEPHGLGESVRQINLAAVALAREAAGEDTYVLGSMGPTGRVFKSVSESEHAAIRAAFREQSAALCEAGVDALILETFRQPEELALAIE